MQDSIILCVLLERTWFTCYLISITPPCPSAHPPNVQHDTRHGRDELGALAIKGQSGETVCPILPMELQGLDGDSGLWVSTLVLTPLHYWETFYPALP